MSLIFDDLILNEDYSLENFRKYVNAATIRSTVDGVALGGGFLP